MQCEGGKGELTRSFFAIASEQSSRLVSSRLVSLCLLDANVHQEGTGGRKGEFLTALSRFVWMTVPDNPEAPTHCGDDGGDGLECVDNKCERRRLARAVFAICCFWAIEIMTTPRFIIKSIYDGDTFSAPAHDFNNLQT
jgi:hypothetical protein